MDKPYKFWLEHKIQIGYLHYSTHHIDQVLKEIEDE